MSQAPTPAYRLHVHRGAALVPLTVAIEEVWSGDTRPEEFDVALEPGPVPQVMAIPTGTRSNEIALIIVDDTADFDTWDVRIEAEQVPTDPADLNSFLTAQLPDEQREELTRLVR